MKIPSVFVALFLFAAQVAGQDAPKTRKDLIGTWRLVSAKITTDGGGVQDSWGPNPVGFLTYTVEGRMSAILSFSNRKELSTADFISAPEPERAEAFASVTAYAGTFTVSGNKVVHHVEIATTPNDVGKDLERQIEPSDAQHLILRVANPYMRGGMKVVSHVLVWERVK
jgi:hypothetical protein